MVCHPLIPLFNPRMPTPAIPPSPTLTIAVGIAGIKTANTLMAISSTRKTIEFFIVCSFRFLLVVFIKNVHQFFNIRVIFDPVFKKNYWNRYRYGKIGTESDK